jgi:hypothetical protein
MKKQKTIEIQGLLNLKPIKEIEIDGVGMGVLPDGSSYLTARGLARMCGIEHSVVIELVNNWSVEHQKPRGKRIADLMFAQGFSDSKLFVEVEVDGSKHHAFKEPVCMALLEYYAFEAGPNIREQAQRSYRTFARSSLRAFVYTQVGFDSKNYLPISWTNFRDRVSLTYNRVPPGFFSVFKEIADLVIALIESNVPIDHKTVPDISVGIAWGKHWEDGNFDLKYGKRIRYEHNYPEYFPQSVSNPQLPWAYPDAALGEFRNWFRVTYLADKFPKYIRTQEKKRMLSPSIAKLAIEAVGLEAALA